MTREDENLRVLRLAHYSPDIPIAIWRDVEERSLHCPHLHAAVTMIRKGEPRETVIVSVLMSLSRANQELREQLTSELMRRATPSVNSMSGRRLLGLPEGLVGVEFEGEHVIAVGDHEALPATRCPMFLVLGPQGQCRLPYGHEGDCDFEPPEEASDLVKEIQAIERGDEPIAAPAPPTGQVVKELHFTADLVAYINWEVIGAQMKTLGCDLVAVTQPDRSVSVKLQYPESVFPPDTKFVNNTKVSCSEG